MKRILLVCLGNICRSPTAHGILYQKIADAGLGEDVALDSAGTAGWHVGKSPDSRAVAAAAQRGYDLSRLRARQVQEEDFERFDLILAMDDSNLHELRSQCSADSVGRVRLFLECADLTNVTEVPDPYYGGDQGFHHVIDLVEEAADKLVSQMKDGSLWLL